MDKITLENRKTKDLFIFPVFRWIRPNDHYLIVHLDTSLPQSDQHQEQRRKELEDKCSLYQLEQKISSGPAQVILNNGMTDIQTARHDRKND